jgi:hypothetical protein
MVPVVAYVAVREIARTESATWDDWIPNPILIASIVVFLVVPSYLYRFSVKSSIEQRHQGPAVSTSINV